MTTSEKRKKFLKTLKFEMMSSADIVKFLTSFAIEGKDIGAVLHKININYSDEKPVPQEDFEKFTDDIYSIWKTTLFEDEKNVTTFLQTLTSEAEQSTLKAQKNFIPPIISQTQKSTSKSDFSSTFLHVQPNSKFQTRKTTCRLYLNLDVQKALILGVLLSDKCVEKNIPLYFKIWTTRNERNDTFVIFTNYDHVQKIVNILQEIEETKPKLFDGATNANPFLARVDKHIFFGEEPMDNGPSFTRIRAMALTEFFEKFNKNGELAKADNEKLAQIITNSNLEPFFTKYGISIKKPFLNLESQPTQERE